MGVIVKRLSLSRRGHRHLPGMQPASHLEDSRQAAFPRLPGSRSWTLSLWGAAGRLQRQSSEKRDAGKHAWRGGLGERLGTEGMWGRARTIHQRLGTFSEVYWKFSPLSCSIKRKKEEEKNNMLQLPLSQHMLRRKTGGRIASLSHPH